MNQDASLLLWAAVAGLFIAGVIIGLIVGRLSNPDYRRMRRLQDELEAVRAELAAYQGRVTDHFAKTARLFNRLNDDHQQVYRHLAAGCHTLCREDRPRIEAEAPGTEESPADRPAPEAIPESRDGTGDKGRLAGNEGLGIG